MCFSDGAVFGFYYNGIAFGKPQIRKRVVFMEEYLQGLNTDQYNAVATIEGTLLIIAGAETGKTKTLISRVCHILNSGVAPELQ